MKMLSILCSIFILYCSSFSSIAKETLSEINLSLVNNSGICQLIYGDTQAKINTKIHWPCNFHRSSGGGIRFLKIQDYQILLIESSRPHAVIKGNCLTEIQALKLFSNKITMSNYSDRVSVCPPFKWDEKMFTGLFSDQG